MISTCDLRRIKEVPPAGFEQIVFLHISLLDKVPDAQTKRKNADSDRNNDRL
jgi:hypothetical protein